MTGDAEKVEISGSFVRDSLGEFSTIIQTT